MLLAHYAIDAPLWRDGVGEAELHHLLQQRALRLERLARALQGDGIDLVAGLAASDPLPLLDALECWCDAVWQGHARRETALSERWSERVWPHADEVRAFTLISDLAIALGERAIRCDAARWAWGVDRYADHEADGVPTFGRVVVLDPSLERAAASPPVFDALGMAYGRYQAHAFGSASRQRFVDGLRPVLWYSHRALYSATSPPPARRARHG
jgi:hypothetical protein